MVISPTIVHMSWNGSPLGFGISANSPRWCGNRRVATEGRGVSGPSCAVAPCDRTIGAPDRQRSHAATADYTGPVARHDRSNERRIALVRGRPQDRARFGSDSETVAISCGPPRVSTMWGTFSSAARPRAPCFSLSPSSRHTSCATNQGSLASSKTTRIGRSQDRNSVQREPSSA